LLLPIGDPAGEAALAAELEKLDGVVAVDGLSVGAASRLPDALLPASLVEQFHSDKSSMLVLTTRFGTETEKAFTMVEQVREAVDRHTPEAVIAGGAFTYKDLKDVTDADSRRVAIISAIFIFLIVLITFRSLAIPIIAVFLIQTAIWVNVGLVYFTQTPISFISFIIIGAIQLGATVDYAILYISRYKENLALMPPLNAARKTMTDTAKSILTSALILISATFSVYFIATIRTGSELCLFIGRGALISTLMVMLILPGLMVLFDPFIRMTTIGWPKKRSANP
jgi:predicted RND superfamily exporter protein